MAMYPWYVSSFAFPRQLMLTIVSSALLKFSFETVMPKGLPSMLKNVKLLCTSVFSTIEKLKGMALFIGRVLPSVVWNPVNEML